MCQFSLFKLPNIDSRLLGSLEYKSEPVELSGITSINVTIQSFPEFRYSKGAGKGPMITNWPEKLVLECIGGLVISHDHGIKRTTARIWLTGGLGWVYVGGRCNSGDRRFPCERGKNMTSRYKIRIIIN